MYEGNHGDVSYWRTKRKAYKEARDIIMTNPYHYETEEAITRKDISDEDIEEYNYCVGSTFRTLERVGYNPTLFV